VQKQFAATRSGVSPKSAPAVYDRRRSVDFRANYDGHDRRRQRWLFRDSERIFTLPDRIFPDLSKEKEPEFIRLFTVKQQYGGKSAFAA
jgi:hypothetical protein